MTTRIFLKDFVLTTQSSLVLLLKGAAFLSKAGVGLLAGTTTQTSKTPTAATAATTQQQHQPRPEILSN
eukprot:3150179-Amphidinium_carterae.1